MLVANPMIKPAKSFNKVDPKITTKITPKPHVAGVVIKFIILIKFYNFYLLFFIFGRTIE